MLIVDGISYCITIQLIDLNIKAFRNRHLSFNESYLLLFDNLKITKKLGMPHESLQGG